MLKLTVLKIDEIVKFFFRRHFFSLFRTISFLKPLWLHTLAVDIFTKISCVNLILQPEFTPPPPSVVVYFWLDNFRLKFVDFIYFASIFDISLRDDTNKHNIYRRLFIFVKIATLVRKEDIIERQKTSF